MKLDTVSVSVSSDTISPDKKEKKKMKEKPKPEVDMAELFDIVPNNGVLKPGESETVELTFNALCANLSVDGLAVCEVEGGPEYEIPLKGDSNTIAYNVSITSHDFGDVPFTEMAATDFYIENKGKVAYQFGVNLDTVSRIGVVEV